MMFRHLAAFAAIPTVFEIMVLKNKSHVVTFPSDDVKNRPQYKPCLIDYVQKKRLSDSSYKENRYVQKKFCA
jgi:hypothetical protein